MPSHSLKLEHSSLATFRAANVYLLACAVRGDCSSGHPQAGVAPVQVSDLGEFGLLERLAAHLPSRPDVILSPGDDAALVDLGAAALLVATVDAPVDGRHFLRPVAPPQEIGHKALAVNLSDIAVMGADPLWALASLLSPPPTHAALL